LSNNHKNIWTDKDVERHWDSVASIYIKENNKVKEVHNQRFIETIQYLNIQQNSKVINISSRDCEANDYVKKVSKSAYVINAEISTGLMQQATKLRPYVNQIKIDTYSELQFESNYFDRVVTLETLEHVQDPISFLSELFRISTQDAIMVLSCPPHTSEIPYKIYSFFLGGHGEGPHRFLPSSEVKIMLKKTGWKLLLHKGTILFPVGPSKIQQFGEKIINCFQNSFISELGIRQFYVCKKY